MLYEVITLIRRYAVAMTPSLRLTDPRPIRRQNVSLLLNGLTESVQGFPPLVHVSSELDTIHSLYGGEVYRDSAYRKAAVQQELEDRQYAIVHFATHGQFSGKVRDVITSYSIHYTKLYDSFLPRPRNLRQRRDPDRRGGESPDRVSRRISSEVFLRPG